MISTSPTEAELQTPAYLKVLNQNKIDRQGSGSRESGSQTAEKMGFKLKQQGREGKEGIRVIPKTSSPSHKQYGCHIRNRN